MSAPNYSDSPGSPTKYLGQNYRFTPTYIRKRNPTVLDIRPKENQGYYPIGSLWINTSLPPEIWILARIFSSNKVVNAEWVLIANSLITGPVLTLSGDTGGTVPPSSDTANPPGNILLTAGAGITTQGVPGSNEIIITNTGTMSNFAPDTGTNPVSGATVTLTNTSILATGTLANAIRSNGTGASILAYQVQYAGSNAAVSAASNWGVAQFDSNSFTVASGFVTLNNAGTTGAVTGLLGDDAGINIVVPSSGTITLDGVTCANATNAKPVFFKKNAASTEELDVQLATTSTSGTKNINKSGLAHFDSASFTIDAATGFVSLAAGGTDVQTLTGNSGGAISPTAGNINTVGTGSITIAGAGSTLTTQLTGLTNHNVLIGAGTATMTNVPPSATSGVPLISQGAAADPAFGTAVVAGGGTGATSFTAYSVICGGTTSTNPLQNVSGVGTANQVLTSNGAGALPSWQTAAQVTQFTLDAATSPINPSAGNITLTGAQVPNGTVGANVIRTRGNSGSSCTIEIQRSDAVAVADSTQNGVCHFDSSKFNVNTNGFVTFTGSTSNISWTDEGGNFVAGSNQGFFCTALLTATLPPTPAQGDVVRIVADTASAVTVTANTGQKIRIGNTISALAGTAASTKQGDSLDLVYRSSSAVWYQVGGVQGSWTIT